MPEPISAATLHKSLGEAGRALSTATVIYHQLVADHLELNASDHKCLDLLLRGGDMTAGDLATRSGFTTGAITGIVSRLVARGFVRRAHDKSDGRRVLLRPVPGKVHESMGPLLLPMIGRMAALQGRYRVSELALLLDYVQRSEAVLRESAQELAARQKSGTSPRKRTER
jgi:hypothetical protein